MKEDEKKKKEFYIALIILLCLVMKGAYTIAYELRTAYHMKNYYEELMQDTEDQDIRRKSTGI